MSNGARQSGASLHEVVEEQMNHTSSQYLAAFEQSTACVPLLSQLEMQKAPLHGVALALAISFQHKDQGRPK